MTDDIQKVTYAEVEAARRNFAGVLKRFRAQRGRYHNPAPELPPEALAGCEVLPNRLALIDRLADGPLAGGNVAEIGVDTGDFSRELLTRLRPAELHLFDIDIARLTNPEIRAGLASDEGRIRTHVGDSSTNMRRLPDGHFDLIYIDGDHEYEGVMRDIEAAAPKLKPGGAMIFNDYTVWSAATMYHCGVARAVHEFCLKNPWKFRYLALQSMMYNDVMLVPR